MTIKLPGKLNHGQKVGKTHVLKGGHREGVDLEWWLEKDGVRDGQCLLLYPRGKTKQETHYVNGKLEGPSRYYSIRGVMLAEGKYKNGVREGVFKYYTIKGKLYAILRYSKGQLNGLQEYFYPNGQLKTSMHYKKGRLQNTVVLYTEKGKVSRKIEV